MNSHSEVSRRVIEDDSRSSDRTSKPMFVKRMSDQIFSHLKLPPDADTTPLKTKLSKKSRSFLEVDDDLSFSEKKRHKSKKSERKSKRSSRKHERSRSSSPDDERNSEDDVVYRNFDSRSFKSRKRASCNDDSDTESTNTSTSYSKNSSRSNSRSHGSHYSKNSSRSASFNDSIESQNSIDSNSSRRVKKQRSSPTHRSKSSVATENSYNPSPLHNKSLGTVFTPTKRVCVEMDKAVIDSSNKSNSFKATKVSYSPTDSCRQGLQKHRQFIARASENKSSGLIRESFSSPLRGILPQSSPLPPMPSLSTPSPRMPPLTSAESPMPPFVNSSNATDSENIFSPLSTKSFATGMSNRPVKIFSAEKSHRLSERFTASTAASDNARYYRKRPSQPDMDFSPRVSSRSSLSGQDFFATEMKSTNFLNYMDERETDMARNILQTQINSNVPFVDTHCHFDFLFKRMSFYESVDEYYEKTFFRFPKNFEGCIADWCQPTLYQRAKSLLNTPTKHFKLWGAFGCHPHFVSDYNDIVEQQIIHHITQYESVVAWGEMGLDYSDRFGKTDHNLQQHIFIRQLREACRRNLPLVIHCRDADPDLLAIMKQHVPHHTKIHRHCLTTEEKDVHELLEHFPNCYVGFTNLLTNRSAYRPRDAVSKIPLNRIILETDAPYFVPRCVATKSHNNARWSHPGMASNVAGEISLIKNISVDEVLETARDNVYRLYGI